jgi:hypothetical protein
MWIEDAMADRLAALRRPGEGYAHCRSGHAGRGIGGRSDRDADRGIAEINGRMIRIAISTEAFEAVAAMLASGNVLYEGERTAQGGYLVWLDETVVNNLERLRGPRDEDLSPVIVRLFGEQANEQIAELLGSEQGPSEEGS